MPELPEVETVANALRPHLVDRKIARIDTFIDKLRTPVTLAHHRDFWQDASASPKNQGFHYNQNAGTYMMVGDALGRGMVKLLNKKK